MKTERDDPEEDSQLTSIPMGIPTWEVKMESDGMKWVPRAAAIPLFVRTPRIASRLAFRLGKSRWSPMG